MATIKTKRERVKFASDNVAGACPEVLEALLKANEGDSAPYGNDDYSKSLQKKFSEIFEKEVIVYHLIKSLKKVSGFLGPQGKPSPIAETEVQKILGNMEESVSNPTNSVIFTIGEQVKVSDGPFASFNGLVEDIDEEKSRLKVSVSIFGRPTPVDLDYTQVEKL